MRRGEVGRRNGHERIVVYLRPDQIRALQGIAKRTDEFRPDLSRALRTVLDGALGGAPEATDPGTNGPADSEGFEFETMSVPNARCRHAAELRRRGMTLHQVGEAMGVSHVRVVQLATRGEKLISQWDPKPDARTVPK